MYEFILFAAKAAIKIVNGVDSWGNVPLKTNAKIPMKIKMKAINVFIARSKPEQPLFITKTPIAK